MTHETEIGGRIYYCDPHTFDESIQLELDLAEVLGGPAGGALAAIFNGFKSVEPQAVRNLGVGIVTLAKAISAKGGPALIRRILKHTRVRVTESGAEQIIQCSAAPSMDILYRGNTWEMWRAVAWVCSVNFNPFGPSTFGDLTPLLSELGSKLKQELAAEMETMVHGPEPKTSTDLASESAPS